MQTREVVAGWLRELAAKADAAPFTLDDNGACLFEFGGRFKVGIQVAETTPVAHLYAIVATPPAEGREQFFERLLRLNAFGVETGGATFALDGPSGAVILCYNVLVDGCDALGFENAFGCFLEVAERWYNELARAEEAPPESTTPESDGTFLRV